MSLKISEIDRNSPQLDVVAMVMYKSEVFTYGSGGTYMNIDLFDGDTIKLSVFGTDVKKMEQAKVRVVNLIYISKKNIKHNINIRKKFLKKSDLFLLNLCVLILDGQCVPLCKRSCKSYKC